MQALNQSRASVRIIRVDPSWVATVGIVDTRIRRAAAGSAHDGAVRDYANGATLRPGDGRTTGQSCRLPHSCHEPT